MSGIEGDRPYRGAGSPRSNPGQPQGWNWRTAHNAEPSACRDGLFAAGEGQGSKVLANILAESGKSFDQQAGFRRIGSEAVEAVTMTSLP